METDYSEAGRSLLANLVSQWGGAWWGENVNKMDCLYTHPHTGASPYVGGWEAAEDLCLLQEAGVTKVVNCTTDLQCPHNVLRNVIKAQ